MKAVVAALGASGWMAALTAATQRLTLQLADHELKQAPDADDRRRARAHEPVGTDGRDCPSCRSGTCGAWPPSS